MTDGTRTYPWTPQPDRPATAVAAAAALLLAGCLGPGGPEADGGPGQEPFHRPLQLRPGAEAELPGCSGPSGGSPDEGSRGAGWADLEGDGDLDLYVACDGPNRLYRQANGTFQEVASQGGVAGDGNSWGVSWADADGDGCLDLYVANAPRPEGGGGANTLHRGRCDGTFEPVPGAGGASGGGDRSRSAAWADHDRDGDLDLFVANRGQRTDDGRVVTERNRLYENRGNLTFEDVAPDAGVAGPAVGPVEPTPEPTQRGFSLAATWLDYDRDGRPDLFVTDGAGVSPLYRNVGNGSFVDVTEEAGLATFARDRGVAAGDVDGDRDVDLYVTRRGPDALWENRHEDVQARGTFRPAAEAADLAGAGPGPGWGTSLADLDNDRDLDLFVAQGSRGGDPLPDLLLRNDGDGTFTNVTDEAGLGTPASSRAAVAGDADADGALDLHATHRRGPDRLHWNRGPQGAWLGLDLEANRSAPGGVGAAAYALAGGKTSLREVRSGGGYPGSQAGPLHLGLGNRSTLGTLEVRWPSGIRQVVHKIEPVNRTIPLAEEQTVKTSCPLLFGSTGDGFGFRSDVLGNAYMGWRYAPGDRFMVPDPTERIRFDELEPRNGSYELRILEALEEINYLDEVELTAVDHPPDVEVLPDEAFNAGPPHDDLGLVQARDPEPVAGAWLDGRDVTGLVTGKDGESPDVPRRPAPTFDGYAEEHTLTLDLGDDVADAATVQLLVDGWVYYPMVTPELAVEGPYVPPRPPTLEAYDPAEDRWVPVEAQVGFPAGLPKQMTANLTGELPDGATRIRLTTNLQIHWDRIRVDTTPDAAPARVTSVDPGEASLGWKGYPIYSSPGPQEPGSYDYDRIAGTHVWDTPAGNYTRYGDVTPLLQEADDRFVLFRHGDEVRVRFPAGALPSVPDGWERTLFVDLEGFFKDMEEHNAYPETVRPLPFHAMENYPPEPADAYRDDPDRRRYLEEWNTRYLGEDTPAARAAS